MAIDRYATRHCPVLVYTKAGLIEYYHSISECSRKLGLSVQRIKWLLHTTQADELGREYDIPVQCPWMTRKETVERQGRMLERIRIIRKAAPKYERQYRGGAMKIVPRADYMLLEKVEEQKTKGGLYIPEAKHSEVTKARIVEAGESANLKEGVVLYPTSDATEIKADDKVLYLIPESSILAVVEEE